MKLIIFGSTGNIGRQLVLQSLQLGHSVTAFARSKEKLNDIDHDNLTIYQGDVLDLSAVIKAVKGHDVVLCALGGGRKGTIRSQGTYNIIKAMEKTGVMRFICQTTLGAGDSKGNLNFFWKYIMFGWLLKEAFLDHELQEKYIRESGLDWTIVRPGAFVRGKATGKYKHGFAPNDRSVKLKISMPDVALFMLMQLSEKRYLKQTPALSY
jgi:putative NADH-flavin reductase